jgi:NADH-quinone oxidoreductase subunit L
MTMPQVSLAVLSTAGGFIGLPAWMNLGPSRFEAFLEPSLERALPATHAAYGHGTEFAFAAISVAVALAGIYVAYRMYFRPSAAPERIARGLGAAYRLVAGKYFVDEAYDAAFIRPVVQGSTSILWKGMDTAVIDGAVNGTARVVRGAGSVLKHVQNGFVRGYAAWILAGAVAILLYITLAG